MVTVLRSGPKCVKYCRISDLWPFCFFTLNGLVTWSLILHQYSNAHELYVHRIFLLFFTVLLSKLQYEILVCQMKKSSRGERPSAAYYNASVCKGKCVLPYFQGLDRWRIDDPIKPGNREHRKLFCTLWFSCEIVGVLLEFGAVSPQSVHRSCRIAPFFKIKNFIGSSNLRDFEKWGIFFVC